MDNMVAFRGVSEDNGHGERHVVLSDPETDCFVEFFDTVDEPGEQEATAYTEFSDNIFDTKDGKLPGRQMGWINVPRSFAIDCIDMALTELDNNEPEDFEEAEELAQLAENLRAWRASILLDNVSETEDYSSESSEDSEEAEELAQLAENLRTWRALIVSDRSF